MTPILPRQPGFNVVPLWDLAAGHRQLEADVQEGFGAEASESNGQGAKDELKRILDRIGHDLQRLKGFVGSEEHDTTPELCLDEYTKVRPPTPTMIVDRLSKMVETIRTLEATAYDTGQYPLADGLSALGHRFEETLWMMVVNIRDSILSNPNSSSNSGPPAGPNT
jgi:hypothetical protein